eukprot:scaffold84749_cov69-Phaeocystis_antarctica.AAC.1
MDLVIDLVREIPLGTPLSIPLGRATLPSVAAVVAAVVAAMGVAAGVAAAAGGGGAPTSAVLAVPLDELEGVPLPAVGPLRQPHLLQLEIGLTNLAEEIAQLVRREVGRLQPGCMHAH